MVKKVIAKPHLFFFGLIPVFVFIAIFYGEQPVDINIHDTYYVSHVKFWSYISAVFFTLIGLNYYSLYWAQKPPKKWLTILHISLQIIALIPYIYLLLANNKSSFQSTHFDFHQFMVRYLIIAFFIFLLSLFFHLINFFTSLFLKAE